MYYNYLLQNFKNGDLYTGYTVNLKRRLQQHNDGTTKTTKRVRAWKLIYYEACLDKDDASRREKYLKTSQGKRLLQRRLKEYIYKFNRKNILN